MNVNDPEMLDSYLDFLGNRLPDDIWNRDFANSLDVKNYQEQQYIVGSNDLFSSPITNSATAMTPPNSPSNDAIKSEGDPALTNLVSLFPEILEYLPLQMDFGSILSDLHATLPFELPDPDPPVKTKSKGTPKDQAPCNSAPCDPALCDSAACDPALCDPALCDPALCDPAPCSETSEDKCLNKDIMWSNGCQEWVHYSARPQVIEQPPAKVRKMSGDSDCISYRRVATSRPSPIRYSDEEYEHLPETPGMSDTDVEENEMNDANEKSCNVKMIQSFINASVKSEHNYCDKRPLNVNASIDTPAASDTDDDDCKFVEIENTNAPFRILYKPSAVNTAPKPRVITKNFYNKIFIQSPATQTRREVTHTIKREMTPTIKREIIPIIKQEMTPVIKQEMTPAIKQEMTPAIKQEMAPAIKQEMAPAIKQEISLTSKENMPLPISSSAEVKKQLQITIQQSMKNKQIRTFGRSVKSINAHNITEAINAMPACQENIPLFSSDRLQAAATAAASTIFKRTRGKPEAYTKRMMDQHTESVKKIISPTTTAAASKKRKLASDPEDNLNKRHEHNTLERIRRVNLKHLFENLRDMVPALLDKQKASKVTILREATKLTLSYVAIDDKRAELMKERNRLLKYLESKDSNRAADFRRHNRSFE